MNKYCITGIIINGLVCLFFLCPAAISQNAAPAGNAGDEGNTWKSGWHIDAGGGVQTLFSSDVTNLSLTQRITPAVSLGIGKWFSPFWGIRLQASGYRLNGFSTTEGTYLFDPDPVRSQVTIRPDGSYRHYLRYLNGHADVEVSLFNLLGGYRENRKWDVIPALGAGYMRSLGYKGTPVTNNVSANFSLKTKYAVTSCLDINLEVSAAAFNDNFDGRTTNRKYEAYSGLTLGITYNFNKPKYHRLRPLVQIMEQVDNRLLFEKIEKRLSAIEARLNDLEIILPTAQPTTPPTIVEKVVIKEEPPQKTPFVLTSICFDLYKHEEIDGQDVHLINVVKYLISNPEAKIRLDGYGDKQVGTQEQNLQISRKRAVTIRRKLIMYGVDAERIEIHANGSNSQPYENNDWNRVVVISVL